MYYKVVLRESSGKLFSCVAYDEWRVEYRLGERVQPNIAGSKLMVFDTLANAESFALPGSVYRIYECEVENPVKANYISYVYYWNNLFWINYKYGTVDYDRVEPAIPGTVFVDSIKLIKEAESVD